jgi:predicted dehydrogenase
LDSIKKIYHHDEVTLDPSRSGRKPFLMVGFNRRFSPYIQEVKRHTEKRINPLFIHYRMNAGYIPLEHWVHTTEGGGRIIGEACHIIDLFSYLIGSPVKSFATASISPRTTSLSGADNRSILFEYEDGSIATLEYFAVGSKSLSKELLEIHYDEKSLIVDDYKSILGYGEQVANINSKTSKKGHFEELEAMSKFLLDKANNSLPIDLESIFETTKLAIEISSAPAIQK